MVAVAARSINSGTRKPVAQSDAGAQGDILLHVLANREQDGDSQGLGALLTLDEELDYVRRTGTPSAVLSSRFPSPVAVTTTRR